MEPHLYIALCDMMPGKKCDVNFLTPQEREQWQKRLTLFDLRDDGGLMWKGFKFPTMEQLESVLQRVHLKTPEWHCRDLQVLRKALSDLDFALPVWLGGLTRACNL